MKVILDKDAPITVATNDVGFGYTLHELKMWPYLSQNCGHHRGIGQQQCCGSKSESERIRTFLMDPNPIKSSDSDSKRGWKKFKHML
jgi:hypothetical protein